MVKLYVYQQGRTETQSHVALISKCDLIIYFVYVLKQGLVVKATAGSSRTRVPLGALWVIS